MTNNQSKPRSRWGAAPSTGESRDRSQSWTDRPPRQHQHQQAPPGQRRGYETTNVDGPPPFPRDRDREWDRRDFDRRRDGPSEYHDWRCMECGICNDPRDERCPRCGQWKPPGGRDDRAPEDRRGRDNNDYYGPSRHSRDFEDDYDGRQRSRKKSRNCEDVKKSEWPPAFEAAGASYIFDARSGMFYEPASDFFYDPKTKFYYSNKKQKYFQFVVGMVPPFQGVGEQNDQQQQEGVSRAVADASQTAPNGDVPARQTEAQIVSSNGVGGDSKSKIAISLKTTLLPSLSTVPVTTVSSAATERSKLIEKLRKASGPSAAGTASAEVVPQIHKQHAKDMGVWSERVKELKGEEDTPPANLKTTSATPSNPTEIKTTPTGQPICIICRRKFANLDKLQQHEKLSALHKENLSKKAGSVGEAAVQKELATPEQMYRDRSKERRMMYSASSVDASRVDILLASVDPLRSETEKKTEVIQPEKAFGDANVGNQLLQKLGWKSGDTLGRKQEGGNGSESKSGNDAASSLRNDWERIESLVQSGGRGSF